MITAPPAVEGLSRGLAPWKRRIRFARAVRWGVRGLSIGTLGSIVALAVARLTPWADAISVALGLVCIGGLGGFVSAWFAPLSKRRAAGTVDAAAHLADRVATAWELRERDETFARLQRTDALAWLRQADPGVIRPRLSRGDLGVLAVLLVVGTVALVAPNPMLEVLRQQQAEQARIRAAQKQVQELAKKETTSTNQSTIDQARIAQELRELARQLGQTKDVPNALAAVSRAEQSLRQQVPRGGEQEVANLSAEAHALQQNELTRPLGNALAAGDSAALARATSALQEALAKLTPEERVAIARALQEAANAGRGATEGSASASTSASLRAASQAIQQGDLGEASAQLSAVQAGLGQQLSVAETAQNVDQAIANLSAVRQTLSGIASSDMQAAQSGGGQTGQGTSGDADQSGQGAGQNPADATQTGAAGQTGDSAGQVNGAGTGQGTSAQTGGGTGGRAQGGGRRAAEPGKAIPGDQIYIPGQSGAGDSLQEAGPAGPALGAEVPYQQVIGQYAQSAREHLDRQSLPPAMRDLVRKYFTGLEETGSP